MKELLVATGSQVETGAPLLRLEPLAEDDDEAAAPGGDEPAEDLELPSGRVGPHRRRRASSTSSTDLSGMLLGYDLDPGDEGRTLAAYLTARQSLSAESEVPHRERGVDCSRCSPTSPSSAATARPARTSTSRTACTRPREYFHTYLHTPGRRAGRPARGVPPAAAARPCATTASRASTGPASSTTPCSGSSSPSSVRLPTSSSSWRSCSTGCTNRSPPTRPWPRPRVRCWTGWCSPPSCASPSSATWPAACGSAGSTSRSSTPSALPCWRRCASSSSCSSTSRTPRTAPSASTRSPRSRSRSSGSSWSGSRHGMPATEPMLEVLVRRHYREYELDDLHVDHGRRAAVRRRRLPPRRPADAPRLDDRRRSAS